MSLSYLLLRGQWRLAPSLTRTIFSDEYLGGDKFLAKKEDYLNTHSVAQRERQKAVALQQTGAAQDGDGSNWGNVLLSDDVERLLYSASNSEDLEAAADVIRMFARRAADTRVENPSVQRMNRTLARDFTVAGRQLRVLAPVKQLVGDPTFQKQIQVGLFLSFSCQRNSLIEVSSLGHAVLVPLRTHLFPAVRERLDAADLPLHLP